MVMAWANRPATPCKKSPKWLGATLATPSRKMLQKTKFVNKIKKLIMIIKINFDNHY
jgi:hypothetical protein